MSMTTQQVARSWSEQFDMQKRAYSKVIDMDYTRLTAFFHFALINLCGKVSDDDFADAVQRAVEYALEGSPAAAGNAEPVVAEQQSLSTQPHPQEITGGVA